MILRVYNYSKFLPKAFLWTTRLLSIEKRKEIESASDLPSFLSVMRTTRVAGYIPMTADPFIIEISIKKFYKNEINNLFSMLPEGDVKTLRKTLLHEYIREIFYTYRHIVRGEKHILDLARDAMLTLSPSYIDSAIEIYEKNRLNQVEFLKKLIEGTEDKEYRKRLTKEIRLLESINDVSIFEMYIYAKSLHMMKNLFRRSMFSVDPNQILCPYIDLEIARSFSVLILGLEKIPPIFRECPPLGCFGLEISSIEVEKKDLSQLITEILKIYNKLASFYDIQLDQGKSINELDIEVGDIFRSIMLKYAHKTFVTYPFTLSLPLSLLVLLLEEKNFLLRNLSRVVFV